MKTIRNKIDLTQWGIPSIDDLGETITNGLRKAVEEVLTLAFESDANGFSYASFPAVWGDNDGHGGPAVEDPLTIYLHIDIGKEPDPGVLLRMSPTEDLRDDIAACAEDGSYAEGLARIRDAMRGLADEIDAAIKASEHVGRETGATR